MELLTMTAADADFRVSMETDPVMMLHLGGPVAAENVLKSHMKAIDHVAEGRAWCFKIIPDASALPAGMIGIWETEWRGAGINEMGWMILPSFQGKGIATQAGREILNKARSEKKFQLIHAFPAISNLASNAICRKLGFTKTEEVDLGYQGQPLRCNDWQIRLF